MHFYTGKDWNRNNRRPFWICAWWLTELGQGNHVIVISYVLKAPCSKCFPPTIKRKAAVFKFLPFKELYWKVPFSWRIRVDGRSVIAGTTLRGKFLKRNMNGVLAFHFAMFRFCCVTRAHEDITSATWLLDHFLDRFLQQNRRSKSVMTSSGSFRFSSHAFSKKMTT